MSGGYSLEWFDSLITVSLNPIRTNLKEILPEQINYLKSKIEEEKGKQQSILKCEVFNLLDEQKIKLLINQYHSVLIILLNQAFENNKNISINNYKLKELSDQVIVCIDELLTFVEARFGIYIAMNERVAVTYLSRIRKEVKQKTDRLRIELEKIKDRKSATILLDFLNSFCKLNKDTCNVTFQEVSYIKALLNELETFENVDAENEIFTKLDKILIYMNFNCEHYINYLVQKITRKINALVRFNEKIDYLQFHLKKFNQLNYKAGIALRSQQTNLKDAFNNWVTEEIFYLEKKLHSSTIPLKSKVETLTQKSLIQKEKSKVLCIFSTDQIGIMLRAFDELQILKARSMSEVFKTIVPHLSTPYKEDLSYDAVRSKSYAAEERDKKIVIETLQEVIAKIKRY